MPLEIYEKECSNKHSLMFWTQDPNGLGFIGGLLSNIELQEIKKEFNLTIACKIKNFPIYIVYQHPGPTVNVSPEKLELSPDITIQRSLFQLCQPTKAKLPASQYLLISRTDQSLICFYHTSEGNTSTFYFCCTFRCKSMCVSNI